MKFLLMFFSFILLIPLCDYITTFIIKRCIKLPKRLYKSLLIISIVNIILFPLFFILFRLGDLSIDSLWFKILISILLISVFCRLALLGFNIFTFPLIFIRRIRKTYPLLMSLVAGSSLIYFIFCAVYSRVNSVVKDVEICSSRLPASFNGFRVVQISDFHVGSFIYSPYYVTKVVNQINALNPDIILFTGDLVNSRADELDPYVDILSRLRAPYGVYSILGNHDYGHYFNWSSKADEEENFSNFISLNKKMGWTLLNNESVRIGKGGDSITIAGVENWGRPPFTGNGNLKKAFENVSLQDFKILLSHNPDHWIEEVIPQTDIDLTLSGHTHSMQTEISLFGKTYSPAIFAYKRWGGLYREGEQYLYVNKGLGYTLIPIRIGAYPEITLFTFDNRNNCN